jgi:recombination protein RecT
MGAAGIEIRAGAHVGELAYDEAGPIRHTWHARCSCGWIHKTQARVQAEDALARHLATQRTTPMTDLERTAQPLGTREVRAMIEKQTTELARALPAGDADRFVRLVLNECRATPRLFECSTGSLIGAVMRSAELGLPPGDTLGLSYYVPFKNKKTQQYEASFILGYKGIVTLALRSGQVASIVAREVCEGDRFDYAYGLEDRLDHRPAARGRGEPYAWYAVATFTNGGHSFVVLHKDDVDKHRAQSNSPDSPAWRNHYSAMARKTCVRVMAPWLPLSPEAAEAIESDDRVYDANTIDVATFTEARRPGYVDENGVIKVPEPEALSGPLSRDVEGPTPPASTPPVQDSPDDGAEPF